MSIICNINGSQKYVLIFPYFKHFFNRLPTKQKNRCILKSLIWWIDHNAIKKCEYRSNKFSVNYIDFLKIYLLLKCVHNPIGFVFWEMEPGHHSAKLQITSTKMIINFDEYFTPSS